VALTKCLMIAKGVITLHIRWQYNTTSLSKSEDDTITVCSRRVRYGRLIFTILYRMSVSRKHVATDV
jgi:hypothetical protein